MQITKEQIAKLIANVKLAKAGGVQSLYLGQLMEVFNSKVTTMKGDKGDPGHTPQKGIDYFTEEEVQLIVDNLSRQIQKNLKIPADGKTPKAGTDYPTQKQIQDMVRASAAAIEIPSPKDGSMGPEGRQGQAGKTPVKGKDYFTEKDIADMVEEVLKKVPKVVETRALPRISLVGGGGGGQVKDVVAGSNITIVKTDSGKYIISSSGVSGGGGGVFVDNELVSGSGTTFTLANTPVTGTVVLYAQRQRLYPGTDYSIVGSVITPVLSYSAGDLIADYQTASTSGTPVDSELIAGSGTSFVLANTPIAGSVHIYAERERLYQGTDYSISGSNITTTLSYSAGDLLADYRVV